MSSEGAKIMKELTEVQVKFPKVKLRILSVDVAEAKNAYYARYMV